MIAQDDIGWRYDSRRLVPQWDSFNQRIGYMHPNKPSVQALGFAETFMGWTLAGAQEMCRLENIALMQAEQRSRRGTPR